MIAQRGRTPLGRMPALTAVLVVVLFVTTLSACRRSPTPPAIVPPADSGGSEPSTGPPAAADGTAAPGPEPWPSLMLTRAYAGLSEPLFVTSTGEPPGALGARVFIVEKDGRILAAVGGKILARPFLDISSLVSSGGEQGLLGLAFAPGYAKNGRFYVDYTDRSGDTVVARYRVSGDPNVADPRSAKVILRIDQPYANHNGGCLQFDGRGMLLIGTGDGGSAGDPHGNAQDITSLLGKILRIDVGEATRTAGGTADRSVTTPYSIPSDNPRLLLAGERGPWRDEIWAYGLRNPWRFSIDRETGDVWIGDVGQNAWEEIDAYPGIDPLGIRGGGANFGWNVLEGTHPYPPGAAKPGSPGRFQMPIVEYPHPTGESVTGGYVYRGTRYPALRGIYLYGDYGTGRIWGLRVARSARTGAITPVENVQLLDTGLAISSFGEDSAGELYVCDIGGGAIYRIQAR